MICFQRLVDKGFQTIQFVRSLPGADKTESLGKTTIWILQQETNRNDPFIIVDDDIQFMHDPRHLIIDVPPTAVAIYMGVSKWVYPFPFLARDFHIQEMKNVHCKEYSDQLVRIYGMTGSHAIIFIDRDFVRELLYKIRSNYTIPHDLILATLHHHYHVYALKNPIFYQDHSLGGQEDITLLQWSSKILCFTDLKKEEE
jgi:hypothetical protein